MPLLDHFHPPLSQRRHWESLHASWAVSLADRLNHDRLPEDYFAEPHVHIGAHLQVDVATPTEKPDDNGKAGGTATATKTWTAPPAVHTIPAVFPDVFEVQVIHSEGGPRLVAAIELISPENKDRPETQKAFVAKCASYLSQGISLIIVDVVTNRRANLHDALMEFLAKPTASFAADVDLYAVAYRPLRRQKRDEIDIWPATLQVGAALPTLPLFPAVDLAIPVDLEAAYVEACERLRVS